MTAVAALERLSTIGALVRGLPCLNTALLCLAKRGIWSAELSTGWGLGYYRLSWRRWLQKYGHVETVCALRLLSFTGASHFSPVLLPKFLGPFFRTPC